MRERSNRMPRKAPMAPHMTGLLLANSRGRFRSGSEYPGKDGNPGYPTNTALHCQDI